eukprot:9410502-Lingulodinium_polyedra.AAC.1
MSFVVEAPLEGLELTEGTETQIVYEKLHEEGSGVITFSTKVDGVHRGCFQLKQVSKAQLEIGRANRLTS